jgi:putative transposase
VLNRGNARMKIFHKPRDCPAFLKLMAQACERLPMRVLAYYLMPNHFHLVTWPLKEGDLSRWMQWLTTSHVRRYHGHYKSSGHVWQGRFKSFPVESDRHLWTVCRYVERNPLRANLVKRAEAWEWSSVGWWGKEGRPPFLVEGPVERGKGWVAAVNRPETEAELDALRRSVQRGTPYGSDRWRRQVAKRLGLESTLHPRGRPRKSEKVA